MPKISAKKQKLSERNKKKHSCRKKPIRPKLTEFRIKGCKRSNLDIWLDLDKTLLFAYYTVVADSKGKRRSVGNYSLRPFVKEFLTFCFQIAQKVRIYTASPSEEAESKLDALGVKGKISFQCAPLYLYETENLEDGSYLRQGQSLQFPIKEIDDFCPNTTLIIDDIANFYLTEHRKNVLMIKPFYGDSGDRVLIRAAKFIKVLADQKNRDIPSSIDFLCENEPLNFMAKSARIAEARATGQPQQLKPRKYPLVEHSP